MIGGIGAETLYRIEIEVTWLERGIDQHEISIGVAGVVGVNTVPGVAKACHGTVDHCIISIGRAIGANKAISGSSCPQGRAGIASGAESDIHHGVAKTGALLRSTKWGDTQQEKTDTEDWSG